MQGSRSLAYKDHADADKETASHCEIPILTSLPQHVELQDMFDIIAGRDITPCSVLSTRLDAPEGYGQAGDYQ